MSQRRLETFNLYQNIHFIGIGGIGISALARLLARTGHQVSGSDQNHSKNTDLLVSEGISVKIGHQAGYIPDDATLVIHTTAIPPENEELRAARDKQIKVLSYPQAVGLLTQNFTTICVCGTHGKTTTTAMLGLALKNNNFSPTVIVGSIVKEFDNKNELFGNSDYLVLESCEYQEAFLNYSPKIIILNNIDPEHLDYFGTAEAYFEAFHKFLNRLPSEGVLIANGDDVNVTKLLEKQDYPFQIIKFGQDDNNDFHLSKNALEYAGASHPLNLSIPGKHNQYNAAAAVAAAAQLGLPVETALQSICEFQGAGRRFEIKAKVGKTTIIDDYGHAPAEIQATLQATRDSFGPQAKILAVFQPHQYSRTYHFLKEFGESFSNCDKVYIPNIYKSRDSVEDIARVGVDDLVDSINSNTPDRAENTHNFSETLNRIHEKLSEYDVVITIGAGDITRLSDDLANLN